MPNAIDHYIAQFPEETQVLLRQLRSLIKETAPNAEEVLSYKMPSYKENGPLVYFAAYKNHIGLYPTSTGIAAFKHKISEYKNSKGAIQFPLNKTLPDDLIREIIRFKQAENKGLKNTKSKP